MPIHDWTRVDAGIFHALHHRWISAISDSLNAGILPGTYYALPEQWAGDYGPDVLALEYSGLPAPGEQGEVSREVEQGGGTAALLIAKPKIAPTPETDMDYYRRKQKPVLIRHVSDDRVVAVIEIVSPGNKSGKRAMDAFLGKASELLHRGVHLLVIDLLPPTARDPHGVHAAIWENISGKEYAPPADKPLTQAAYESDVAIRAYVRPVAVGDALDEMPLFLEPDACVHAPLEATYLTAFAAMPQRWRTVLEG